MWSIIEIYRVMLLISLSGMIGLVLGLSSYFLDYCFWPGSIFKGYKPWLASKVLRSRDVKLWYELTEKYANKPAELSEVLIAKCEDRSYFWYKILGGCAVCLNIWLGLISWVVICFAAGLPWWCGFSYIMTSSWLIRKLVGATY